MKYTKQVDWLLERVGHPDIRIIDCRFALGNPEHGIQSYEQGHIPGAVFLDLEKDLSGSVQEHGGRHPLPEVGTLVQKLEEAGISQETTVIAYDNGEGAFAARCWWLFMYLGHRNVFVLDGGYQAWLERNLPVTAEKPSYQRSRLQVERNDSLLAVMEEVRAVTKDPLCRVVLVDSREEKRYLGIEEPIDKKKGHIPGAINKPWMLGLNHGYYLPVQSQQERFADIDKNQEIIVYCGSGVTAAPNFLALKESGFENVKLYAGSFSDWISYEENEIKQA